MRKTWLLLFLLLLSGCSLNTLFLQGEIDKVTVVKYTSYTKHHRAFFARDQFKSIKNGKKYLYLHHKKTNSLAILFHKNNRYILYNLSNPEAKTYSVQATNKKSYVHALKSFKRLGYSPLAYPASKGFIVSVSHQRYKGVKTLMVEAKDYTRLQSKYKQAIRTYNASIINHIKTPLPKVLIGDYYTYYKKRASGPKQLKQLQIIAKKLNLQGPTLAKKPSAEKNITTTQKTNNTVPEEKRAWYDFSKKEADKVSVKKPSGKPYHYYLKEAGLTELSAYMAKETTKDVLPFSQYRNLKQRENALREQKLLKEGSLEELIAAYKVNKKPTYKQRIMSLMKEKQEHKSINLSPSEE